MSRRIHRRRRSPIVTRRRFVQQDSGEGCSDCEHEEYRRVRDFTVDKFDLGSYPGIVSEQFKPDTVLNRRCMYLHSVFTQRRIVI